MKIFIVTTVPLQKIRYYRSSRPIPLLTTLKVVFETSNVYDTTYPKNVIDKMHFLKQYGCFV